MFKVKLRSDIVPAIWITAIITAPALSPARFKNAAIGFENFENIDGVEIQLEIATATRHKISLWDELEVVSILDDYDTEYSELVEALQENDDFLDWVWDELEELNFIEEDD